MSETKIAQGSEIEGKKVSGHSRHPLRQRGLTVVNNIECHRWVAEHNVEAVVVEPIDGQTVVISQTSHKELDARLSAQTADIFSLSDRRSEQVVKQSGRHQANAWNFKKQTLVKIVLPRQEIINSLQKRIKNRGR